MQIQLLFDFIILPLPYYIFHSDHISYRPPEHFWKFEATASLDWAHSFPPYPDYMNLGVAMACDPSFAVS